MLRTMILTVLMLTACDTPNQTPYESARSLGERERKSLCLPIRSEAEIFREAKERGTPESTWREDIASACIQAQARILARGSDAAPIIADAAVDWCEPHANLNVAASIRSARLPKVYTWQEAYADQEFSEWKATTVDHLRNLATREVLQARAGGCFEELIRDGVYSHSVDITP